MAGNLKLRMKLYEKGITQTALAKETEIPRQYISSALTGRVNLSPEKEKNCELSVL